MQTTDRVMESNLRLLPSKQTTERPCDVSNVKFKAIPASYG